MTTNVVYTSSPARICLSGEYLDNVMQPVIACTLNSQRVTASARRSDDQLTHIYSHPPFDVHSAFDIHANIHFTNGPLDYAKAVLLTFKQQGLPIENVALEIKSSIPAAAGLSSSSALCVALGEALNALFDLHLSTEQVCSLAYIAESKNLATGIGQMDQFASGVGGVLYIDCTAEPALVQRLYSRPDIAVVIGSTGKTRNFREVQSVMGQRIAKREPVVMKFIEGTLQVQDKMKALLSHPDWDPHELGGYITQCHTYLRNFAYQSNETIERYVKAALAAHAFGAKLTGTTGEGGSMFALTTRTDAEQIAQALARAGAIVNISQLSDHGVQRITATDFENA